jgi:hypothetical protein
LARKSAIKKGLPPYRFLLPNAEYDPTKATSTSLEVNSALLCSMVSTGEISSAFLHDDATDSNVDANRNLYIYVFFMSVRL